MDIEKFLGIAFLVTVIWTIFAWIVLSTVRERQGPQGVFKCVVIIILAGPVLGTFIVGAILADWATEEKKPKE